MRLSDVTALHAINAEAGPPVLSRSRTFGQILHDARREQRLKIRQVADRMGVSQTVIDDWENDKAIPTRAQLRRLMGTCFRQVRFFTHLLEKRWEMAEIDAIAKGQPVAPHEPPIVEPLPLPPNAVRYCTPPASFGEALARVRLQESLTLKDVGEIVGVDGSTVGLWENNTTGMVRDNFNKLCELFPSLAEAPPPRRVWEHEKPVGNRGKRDVDVFVNEAPAAPVTLVPANEAPAMSTSVVLSIPFEVPPVPANNTELNELRAEVQRLRDEAAQRDAKPAAPSFDRPSMMRWVRVLRGVQPGTEGATVGLLKEAKACGLSIDDVIESLQGA